jgi:hypothetical protein
MGEIRGNPGSRRHPGAPEPAPDRVAVGPALQAQVDAKCLVEFSLRMIEWPPRDKGARDKGARDKGARDKGEGPSAPGRDLRLNSDRRLAGAGRYGRLP